MSNGDSGHYDYDAGVCWDDEQFEEEEDPDTPGYPEACEKPLGGYDEDCLTLLLILEALKKLREAIYGGSD